MATSHRFSPPTGFLRAVLRWPLLVYRLGLGWVFGYRFLMLLHRGRRTGRLYACVLEVACHDLGRQECVVVAGWGENTDWYQNVRAGGALVVQVGRTSYAPRVAIFEPFEVYRTLRGYVERCGLTRPLVRRVAFSRFGLRFDGTDMEAVSTENLRGIAFRPLDH